MTGSKLSILGYMSRGDIVPLVITTDLNFFNTGCMAMEASRQLQECQSCIKLPDDLPELQHRIVVHVIRFNEDGKAFGVSTHKCGEVCSERSVSDFSRHMTYSKVSG